MPEATGTALSIAQHLHFLPLGLLMAGNDHLRYALAVFHHEASITHTSPR